MVSARSVVAERDLGHRLLADVGAADEPFVVGLDGQHRDQPDHAGVVGEDADDVGAAADLAVEALQRIGRPELGPVLGRERVEGQDVVLGLLEQRGDLRQARLELARSPRRAAAGLGREPAVKIAADQRAEDVVLVACGHDRGGL